MQWQTKHQTLTFDASGPNGSSRRPTVMGILNVTPDSFSDGDGNASIEDFVARGVMMQRHGAGIIDIGGESTRPGSHPVDGAEELRRVIPVIRKLSPQITIPISIDTSKAEVAAAAIESGAAIINDVTGLTGDPAMIEVACRSNVGVCAMHMRGTPQTMQDDLHYENVVEEIFQYLCQRRDCLIEHGIAAERICLDPGIGFGKSHSQNWTLVQQASRFLATGCPILVGHSRKGFIGKCVGDDLVARDAGTLGISVALAIAGIHIVRVHEVQRTVAALTAMLSAI